MMNPTSTDYDRPDFRLHTCHYCGEDEEGGEIKGQWVCNWCNEELERAKEAEECEE